MYNLKQQKNPDLEFYKTIIQIRISLNILRDFKSLNGYQG